MRLVRTLVGLAATVSSTGRARSPCTPAPEPAYHFPGHKVEALDCLYPDCAYPVILGTDHESAGGSLQVG
jgi:hypothetical protein